MGLTVYSYTWLAATRVQRQRFGFSLYPLTLVMSYRFLSFLERLAEKCQKRNYQRIINSCQIHIKSSFVRYCSASAKWTPLEIFGERAFRDKAQVVGSSYRIEVTDTSGEACAVEAVMLLHVLNGKIVQEDLYYELNSLVQCGWAE